MAVNLLRTGEDAIGLLAGLAAPLWLLSPDGRVLWLNDAARAVLKIPTDLAPSTISAELPDKVPATLAALPQGRAPTHAITFRCEGRQVATLSCRLTRTGDDSRLLVEAVCAERGSIETHETLLNAIESIGEAFTLHDNQGRLVVCNGKFREMYGEVADLLQPGVRFDDLLAEAVRRGQFPEAHGREEAFLAQRTERFRNPQGAFEQRLTGGRWVRVEEWRTWDGGIVGIRTDVTEAKCREADLKIAREQAEAANRRKSDYVNHLSHELRTPLTAVIGFAQVIANDLLGEGQGLRYREYARQIGLAGGYMLDLINNLLDLAKIDAGRMELNEEPCDLALLTDATLGLVQGRAAEAGIQFGLEIPGDLPAVSADPHLVRQMLTNLITNAVKFSPSVTGRVVIRAGLRRDGSLELSVADNGIGMRPDQIPLALDAFGQAHQPEVARERGTGLGLPLTKALIDLHGGRLELETAPGAGTTVRLVFPADRVPAPGV
ncbi:MAG TPA: ATP-binding protein [Azospirillaceae bacterium]|nr:ATP-binding protein [Azospirillaceae bacterium]